MGAPCVSACSPWSSAEDACAACADISSFPPETFEDWITVATDALFELSGRRFAGACKDIVRPCARRGDSVHYAGSPWGQYRSGVCGCQSGPSCGCPSVDAITLGGYPLTGIVSVKVDGEVLDPSLYRIDDWRHLVRLRDPDGTNPGWPCCSAMDLDADQPGTFEVTYSYGLMPPPLGVKAAAILACQMAMSCDPESSGRCQLPRRVQQVSRQGVSITLGDLTAALAQGRTGIFEVDLFLAVYNKHGLDRPSGVLSPDIGRRVTRAGT